MPQLTTLVLTDREATPVNHTFIPAGITDGLGTVEESTGVPIGNARAQVSVRKTSGGRYVGTLKVQKPVVQIETINGISVPRVVRTAYAELKVTFDPSSSTQERANLVGMVQSALDSSKALVNDTLVGLQAVY